MVAGRWSQGRRTCLRRGRGLWAAGRGHLRGAGLRDFVEEHVTVKDTARNLIAAAEVNTQVCMLLFAPLLGALTLLLSLTASPRIPPLETLAFILHNGPDP